MAIPSTLHPGSCTCIFIRFGRCKRPPTKPRTTQRACITFPDVVIRFSIVSTKHTCVRETDRNDWPTKTSERDRDLSQQNTLIRTSRHHNSRHGSESIRLNLGIYPISCSNRRLDLMLAFRNSLSSNQLEKKGTSSLVSIRTLTPSTAYHNCHTTSPPSYHLNLLNCPSLHCPQQQQHHHQHCPSHQTRSYQSS